jgi:cytochrome P450
MDTAETHEQSRAVPDLSDPAIYQAGRQYETWRQLRAQGPVHWVQPALGRPFWSVLSYDLVGKVLADHEVYRSSGGMRLGADPVATQAGAGRMMVISDEPRHGKIRRIVSNGFTPRMVARLEGTMRTIAAEVIDTALEAGDCDFAGVAARLPVSVICDMLGVPREDWDYMLDRTMLAFGVGHRDGHAGALASQAHIDLFLYYTDLMRLRRSDPQEDLVTALVHGSIDGVPLTDEEIVLNCDGLISGGNETTRHATIGGMLAFIKAPREWRRLREDLSLLDTAVQEVLRYTTPAMHLLRTASEDVALGGQDIRAGDQVAVWLGSANRDEARFSDPLSFDVTRHPNRHLTFAYGPHFCIGSALATMELTVMFRELVNRVEAAELTAEPVRVFSNLIDGYESVPMSMRPRWRSGG